MYYVKDFMKKKPITLKKGSSIIDAISILEEGKFRHLPIVDENGKVVGIISDRDMKQVKVAMNLFNISLNEAEEAMVVDDVMTEEVITVTPDTPLKKAADIMKRRKIGSLPVVENKKLVGIITETDMLRALIKIIKEMEEKEKS